jgi:hypothetical protein
VHGEKLLRAVFDLAFALRVDRHRGVRERRAADPELLLDGAGRQPACTTA